MNDNEGIKGNVMVAAMGGGFLHWISWARAGTVSAWTGGAEAARTESRTTSAAGLAAYYRPQARYPSAQLTAKIVSVATKNAVRNVPGDTPNLMLYNEVASTGPRR
ncbi:hypothetical protein AB0O22_09115 [Streptomyces sp. NPDC091204]|uniref:hypothetical protein n=1 Tax=Streptomyces sp. NPDC091204 TaxID=3155299 RepID=UPI003418EB3E